ncbi:replication initiation protein, partial [Neisseria meningitidis]|nr:replication initiation protein [Neisseria meningitidis]
KDGAMPHRLNPASFMIKEKRACEYIHDYEKEIEIIKFDEYGMVLDSLGDLND